MAGLWEEIQTGLENFWNQFTQDIGIGASSSSKVTGQLAALWQYVQEKPIQRGDSGYHVKLLQGALKTIGITITVDGIYGPNTESAVKSFQKAHGLVETGVADAQTVQVLYSEVKVAASKGNLISELVNLAAQRGMLEVFEKYPELQPEAEEGDAVVPVAPVEEGGINWKPILIGGGLLGLGILLLRD